MMIQIVEDRRSRLIELCRTYRVVRLDLFGSAAQGAFLPDSSDLDFIAQFDATRGGDYAERFYRFAESLEALFGRHVDLLTERMIRNPFFREEVERTRQTIIDLSDEPASAPTPA